MDWTALRQSELGEEVKLVLPPSLKLPMLPRAVIEFSKKADDPDASARELGSIIESDAGLTCELLKHVNSCAVGVRRKVSSAQQAISLLGIRTVKLFVATSAVKQAMSSRDSKLINFQVFWNTNLERALFAREVAKLLGVEPDVAFAGGMLQDFLLPVLTSEMLDPYLKFSEQQDRNPVRLDQFEQAAFGWEHSQAAAQIMFGWGFPDDLICCTLLHHRGIKILADKKPTAADAVAVAALMPDSFRQVPDGLEQLTQLEKTWPKFDLLSLANVVHDEFQKVSPGTAANHFSFLRRCEKALQVAN